MMTKLNIMINYSMTSKRAEFVNISPVQKNQSIPVEVAEELSTRAYIDGYAEGRQKGFIAGAVGIAAGILIINIIDDIIKAKKAKKEEE